jgi:hypothetical protein
MGAMSIYRPERFWEFLHRRDSVPVQNHDLVVRPAI